MSDPLYYGDEARNKETYALISCITLWVFTAIMIPVIVSQSRLVFEVLTGNVPIGSHAKLIQYGTMITVYFSFFSIIASDMLYFANNQTDCEARWSSILNFQQFGKSFSYLVLLGRLYRYYEGTPFAYTARQLNCIGFVAIVFGFVAIFCIILFPNESEIFFENDYPSWCQPRTGLFPVAGAIIIVQDITAAVGFFVLIRPFGTVAEGIAKKEENREKAANAIYHVAKVRVLSMTMLVSTVVFTLLAIITGLGLFGAFDLVITPICLVLMTPHHRYDVCYHRLCCCCLGRCGHAKDMQPTTSFEDRAALINELSRKSGEQVQDDAAELAEVQKQGQTSTTT
eukprot:CAMPEP_0197055994 /NCGR_PEP_ID=MMETSP1384-20130603/77116_1 /TAXON_ID=29189 /ORGANISM="Ammonia sp." /LENGTH=340 /DNA_ID=CAMNT_0042489803 /DNA_START=45 /DNA_END=1067 /DNA_ORIENTATION=+